MNDLHEAIARIAELEAERDRLQHQLDTRLKVYESYETYRNRAEQAEAERDQLREALKKMKFNFAGAAWCAECARNIDLARDALYHNTPHQEANHSTN